MLKTLTAFCLLFSLNTFADDSLNQTWTNILNKFVVVKDHSSFVKYRELKSSPEALETYLKKLSAVESTEYAKYSDNEKLAFLINAYNAFTLKLIIDKYPVKSIKDIKEGFLTGPWDIKFFKLLGEEKTLNNIEHDMIRKQFNEPRIHFALVCASIGCPALRNEAFAADTLSAQLDDAAKNFLTDTTKNRYLASEQKLEISMIFKWYGSDFKNKYGSYLKFISDKVTTDSQGQSLINSEKVSVKFLDYDWSLNEAN